MWFIEVHDACVWMHVGHNLYVVHMSVPCMHSDVLLGSNKDTSRNSIKVQWRYEVLALSKRIDGCYDVG